MTNYKMECPICNKKVYKNDMWLTHDCHGIPYRYVCEDCWRDIMDSDYGYDGEYYTELDECIDYDY